MMMSLCLCEIVSPVLWWLVIHFCAILLSRLWCLCMSEDRVILWWFYGYLEQVWALCWSATFLHKLSIHTYKTYREGTSLFKISCAFHTSSVLNLISKISRYYFLLYVVLVCVDEEQGRWILEVNEFNSDTSLEFPYCSRVISVNYTEILYFRHGPYAMLFTASSGCIFLNHMLC